MKCFQLAIGLLLLATWVDCRFLDLVLTRIRNRIQDVVEHVQPQLQIEEGPIAEVRERIEEIVQHFKPEPQEPEPQIEEGPKDGDVKVGFGPSKSEGVAMMYWHGEWGTICDQGGFNSEGWASVFCKQLGYEAAEDIVFVRDLNNTDLMETLEDYPLAFQKPNCWPRVSESIRECAHNQVDDQDDDFCQLGHKQDCWVTCKEGGKPAQPEEGSVRLVNGDDTNALEGRAEMFVNGSWGTICDAKGLGPAGWPTVFCKQYLDITNDKYKAQKALHIADVPDAPPTPEDLPLNFEMPECFPKDTETMLDCKINHKNELQACGRIKSNGKINYKGHEWDVWVKC